MAFPEYDSIKKKKITQMRKLQFDFTNFQVQFEKLPGYTNQYSKLFLLNRRISMIATTGRLQ